MAIDEIRRISDTDNGVCRRSLLMGVFLATVSIIFTPPPWHGVLRRERRQRPREWTRVRCHRHEEDEGWY